MISAVPTLVQFTLFRLTDRYPASAELNVLISVHRYIREEDAVRANNGRASNTWAAEWRRSSMQEDMSRLIGAKLEDCPAPFLFPPPCSPQPIMSIVEKRNPKFPKDSLRSTWSNDQTFQTIALACHLGIPRSVRPR